MRILFDNNVPIGVRAFLLPHEVRTILEMGWSPTIKNGELLAVAEAAGMDVLLTCDQNIRYQQNLAGRRLAIVVLDSNLWPSIRYQKHAIAVAVGSAKPGTFRIVSVPLPPKPPKNRGQ